MSDMRPLTPLILPLLIGFGDLLLIVTLAPPFTPQGLSKLLAQCALAGLGAAGLARLASNRRRRLWPNLAIAFVVGALWAALAITGAFGTFDAYFDASSSGPDMDTVWDEVALGLAFTMLAGVAQLPWGALAWSLGALLDRRAAGARASGPGPDLT